MNIDIREPTIAQYSIDLNVQTRDFVGNHGGHNLGVWSINVNDPSAAVVIPVSRKY